jgi:acyl-CoA synthetase (NDP forming)
VTGERRLADALLRPRAVALVGASADPCKNTGRPQRFLDRHGFRGTVLPVNPGREEVQGVRAYARVSDAPGPVDHALIMVPAHKVAAAVEDCGRAGVAVATLYSDGFADLGTEEGMARQHELVACARRAGVRLVGPNSMGVMNFHAGLTLSVNAVLEMPEIRAGTVSVVSQSGSILGSLLSRGTARGFGFSKMVSIGNESDLTVGEVMDMLVDDEQTGCIALFLESLRGAGAMGAAARRACAAGKPVVAYKLGRSSLGQRLAATHSGAMTGESEVADAFFRAHGMVRVNLFETLLEIPPLLAAGPGARAPRVSVMTTTGGGAATVVDRLGELGIETVSASDAVAQRLDAEGVAVAGKPIIDLTMAGTRRAVFTDALQGTLDDPASEAVVVVVGSSGQFHPELSVEPIAATNRRGKPLAVYIVPDAPASLSLLADAGIAAFRTPESCADAIATLLEWRSPRDMESPPADLAPVRAALDRGIAGGFDEAAAGAVFAALGVRVAPAQVVDADASGVALEFPVAVKLLSRELSHKTEIGGVVLGVTDADGVRAAIGRIGDSSAARGQPAGRFLIQTMQRGLGEAVVGYRVDAEAGALVSVGLGGRLTEVYRDVALELAPVDLATAREMIARVKGFAALRGYRGLPAGDLEALAEAVVAVSRLALVDAPAVAEAEINPLVLGREGEGAVAVDAVVVLAPAPAGAVSRAS